MTDNHVPFVRTISAILQPLVRILLRYGLSHSEFSEIAKRVYVDVAHQHYRIEGRKQTHSRIAVLTGIPRKEVVRFVSMSADEPLNTRGPLNRAQLVMDGWADDPDFRDMEEIPARGGVGSFEDLVARYSGDITAGAVLDELLRVGAVARPTKDCVRRLAPAYAAREIPTDALLTLGDCVTNLLRSGLHNLEPGAEGSRLLKQWTHVNLPETVIREFKEYSHDRSLELIFELKQWLAKRSVEGAPGSGESTGSVGVGVYYFQNRNGE